MTKLNKTSLAILVTGLLAGTLHTHNSSATEKEPEKTPVTATPRNANTDNTAAVSSKTLNIGDSRTVGMYFSENNKRYRNAIDTDDASGNQWYAKVGEGFSWFEKNLQNIQNRAKDCQVIVINLGVNDLAMSGSSETTAEKYIKCLNNLAKDWKEQGKMVFFSSPNPVGPQYRGANVFNQKIDNFNRFMKNGLSTDITFIDTNSYIKNKLQRSHFDSAGLHYVPSINRDIHQYIESQVAHELAKANNRSYDMLAEMQNRQVKSY